MVNLTIDGKPVSVPEGVPILEAAEKVGAAIPTLCALRGVNEIGACRVCMVKLEGADRLVPSCVTPVEEGMVIYTHSPDVIETRRKNVELILSEHNTSCTSCVRGGNCALQDIASELGLSSVEYPVSFRERVWDKDFPLQRDESKCIKCMRCINICDNIQHLHVWDVVGTGSRTTVGVRDGQKIQDAHCSLCGQCITHCPTGALFARDDTTKVIEALADPDVITIVNTAPAVRTAWGEGLDLPREEATEGRMVSALRELGFDYVFDTDFAADLTIMEEGTELVERLTNPGDYAWPMFTSCCPGWVRFVKQSYPEFMPNLSSAKSPHQMFGTVSKTYFADKVLDVDRKRIFVVSIMPCVAKKYEAGVPELDDAETGADIDAVLTVREFDRMIRAFGIDAKALDPNATFDDPLGLSTGAAVIFGRTGGVMEAALRTAGLLVTGEVLPLEDCDLTECTPNVPWTEKKFTIGDSTLRIAVASGLGNTRALLDAVKNGDVEYDFIEIMACPGGCVGGGGQPIAFNQELHTERAQVIRGLDNTMPMRMSHENPAVQKLYDDYLEKPCGHVAHELLHTDQAAWQI